MRLRAAVTLSPERIRHLPGGAYAEQTASDRDHHGRGDRHGDRGGLVPGGRRIRALRYSDRATEMVARLPGQAHVSMPNRPSDGSERPHFGGWVVSLPATS